MILRHSLGRRLVGFAALLVVAVFCFATGHIVGCHGKSEDPSSEFTLRFKSAEHVFYELQWSDGFLWMIDSNRDGVLDHWRFWKKMDSGEFPTEFWVRDRNSDQRLDEWYKRTGHDEGVLAKDTNFDGVVDEVSPITIVRKYAPPTRD